MKQYKFPAMRMREAEKADAVRERSGPDFFLIRSGAVRCGE